MQTKLMGGEGVGFELSVAQSNVKLMILPLLYMKYLTN